MIKSLDSFNFKNQKCLIRVDFNVPINESGEITDDNRIRQSMKTINKVISDGGIPILMSHLGRPKGEKNQKYSLKPVADYLSKTNSTIFLDDCIGEKVKEEIGKAKPGDIVLLENLRFYNEEEANDQTFSKQLSELGDVYINDAFGTAHRAHSSTEGITKFMKNRFMGYLIEKELDFLGHSIANPVKPFTAIIGGAKISGKIDVIENLIGKCDYILVGGGMMFTFLYAQGYNIGNSIIEKDKIGLAKEILKKAEDSETKLVLPIDTKLAASFDNNANAIVTSVSDILGDYMGLDIGPKTINLFKNFIKHSKTVLWNGPMGVFEFSNFSEGTFELAKSLAEATKNGATTIVGGGDSAAAISTIGLDDEISHISTGGGASLEFLEGKTLPGISALEIYV